jgi:hypothetical protein
MADLAGNSYDDRASAEAQAKLQATIARLEAVINQRERDVKQAMANFTAEGVSDEYFAKEQRWNRAADEVRSIINDLKDTLVGNDGIAEGAQSAARGKVYAI